MNAFSTYHQKTVIDFEDMIDHGIYLISGPTGSGKTTIFDAITFALYGSASGSERQQSHFRSDFASAEEETYVELVFEIHNQIYTIKRSPSYNRVGFKTAKPANAFLTFNNVTIEGLKEVNAKVNELLGVDEKQFKQIVMIAQGEFTKLIYASSEEREKAIKNMSDNLEGLLERTMGSIYTISLDKGSIDMLNEFLNRGNYWKDTSLFLGGNYYSEQTRKKAQEALREDSYYDAQLAALMAQRDEIQKQMQLEDEKKKTDKGKMEDYEKEIRELGVAIDEFAKDFADALYGINFKDWANQLTEAVVDAWSKGEDAAAAYANKVTELLRQVGVSAISQQFLQPLIEEQTKGFIQQFEKDNGKLTEFSMQYLANIYNGAEKAVEYTEAYLEGLKKMGIDLSESSKDASSGLSKGIQSVTEDTANLLGSYLNSIRHDSSVQRTLIEQLVSVDVPQMSIIAQAQLQQLQQVAANTKRNADAADRIYELVNKVVDKGSNKLKI